MRLKTYAIVCTGRSGSTFLCKMLEATGLAGIPKEYLQDDGNQSPRESIGLKHETPLKDFVEVLKEKTSTSNGIFGLKVKGIAQWNRLIESEIKVDYWIYLRRNNRVLHAISTYRGKRSGRWMGDNPPVDYDYRAIADILEHQRNEEQFLAERVRNVPLHLYLSYEKALCQNPRRAVETVLNFIGAPCMEPERIPVDCMPIQRDALTEEFATRFVEDQQREQLPKQNR